MQSHIISFLIKRCYKPFSGNFWFILIIFFHFCFIIRRDPGSRVPQTGGSRFRMAFYKGCACFLLSDTPLEWAI